MRRYELGDHLLDEPPANGVLGLVRVDAAREQRVERDPVLGRIVVEQPVGDHLVHEQVQARVDGLAVDDDDLLAGVDGGRQLGVREADEFRAVVLVSGVQVRRGAPGHGWQHGARALDAQRRPAEVMAARAAAAAGAGRARGGRRARRPGRAR